MLSNDDFSSCWPCKTNFLNKYLKFLNNYLKNVNNHLKKTKELFKKQISKKIYILCKAVGLTLRPITRFVNVSKKVAYPNKKCFVCCCVVNACIFLGIIKSIDDPKTHADISIHNVVLQLCATFCNVVQHCTCC